jgi:hypothetical protein
MVTPARAGVRTTKEAPGSGFAGMTSAGDDSERNTVLVLPKPLNGVLLLLACLTEMVS